MTLEEKKARLAELKAKLAQMKESASIDAERNGLQAAAERLMVDDPIAAFGLLDKSRALDIKEQQAARGLGADSVRMKLVSRKNSIDARMTSMTSSDPEYKILAAESTKINAELGKDEPSIKNVYASGVVPEDAAPGIMPGATGGGPSPFELARTEADDRVRQSVDVKPVDGQLDDDYEVSTAIEGIVRKYGLKEADASAIRKILDIRKKSVGDAFTAKGGVLQQASAAESLSQAQYENWLKNTLPGIDAAARDLGAIRQGFVSALAQGKRSNIGGAYIAMKKTLGDALSNADFAGIAGMGIGEGVIGKLKQLFGASTLTEAQAKEIIISSVAGYNDAVADFNKQLKAKAGTAQPKFAAKATKAYSAQPLESAGYTNVRGTNNADEKKGKPVLRTGGADELDKELGL